MNYWAGFREWLIWAAIILILILNVIRRVYG